MFPEEDDQEMVVNPPIIPEEESSFDEDYIPKPTVDESTLFESLGFVPKASLSSKKIDLKDLVMEKDEIDDRIEKRAEWHRNLKAEKARARTLEEAAKRAETYDSDGSSINTQEKEEELEEQGISVKEAQKTFAGLTADTSSDEEMIPPSLASAFGPISEDLTDPKINPLIMESQAAELIASLPSNTAIRVYNPEADPWKFDK